MIFSTGLKKIYESISKQPTEKRNGLFNQLQEKIMSSTPLTYKFELLEKIKNNKSSFTKDEAIDFVNKLKQKHNIFLKENNSVALFYKEEKKLFEFFNINQNDIISNKLDLIVNKKDNQLNENIIIEYVTDNRLISGKERLQRMQKQLKDQFLQIRSNVNESALNRQIDFINRNNLKISGNKKQLVEASIKIIKEETYKDFNSAVNKAYKLRLLTEELITLPSGRQIEKDTEDPLETSEEKLLNIKEKTFKGEDLTYIKNIYIDVPQNFKKAIHKDLDNEVVKEKGKSRQTWSEEETTENVNINFEIPLYPVAAKLADNLAGIPRIKNQLLKLKRIFMNDFIYRGGITILDPVDSIWDVSMAENVDPEKGNAGKEVSEKGFYAVDAKFNINIFVKKTVTPEKYFQVVYGLLVKLNEFIPEIDFLSSIITPEEQIELIKVTPKGRKTEYGDRSGQDKYYNDTHGEKSDTWSDLLFSGTAEDSEVGGDDMGLDPYFKNKKNKSDDTELSDEEKHKIATAKAMQNKNKKVNNPELQDFE